MGKNFSRNQKRENRNKNDFYQTPHCLTSTFLDYVLSHNIFDFTDKKIADFCCGKRAIGNVFRQYRIKNLIEKDISEGYDFLQENSFSDIGIMNPPFRLFNKWVEKCFSTFSVGFALLAPTTYLQGTSRFNESQSGVFQHKDYPLANILTFNRYPMLTTELRDDGKITTGMQALSWFVFKKNNNLEKIDTVHDWLDIDKYILKRN